MLLAVSHRDWLPTTFIACWRGWNHCFAAQVYATVCQRPVQSIFTSGSFQVTNNAKRTCTVIGLVAAAGLALLSWRSSTNIGTLAAPSQWSAQTGDASSAPSSTAAKVAKARQSVSDPSKRVLPGAQPLVIANRAPVVTPQQAAPKAETAQPPGPAQLPAEAGLVTAGGIAMKGIRALMNDDDFDSRIARLSEQSLQEPLAIDLTALNASAAADASQNVTGVEVNRMACGLQICIATLSAPSLEAFQKWMAWFMSNPSVQVRAVSTGTSTLGDGSIEYRLLITTDSSINRAFAQPGK